MTLIEKPSVITLEHVSYEVQQGDRRIIILDNISVAWKSPCSVALQGASGSGKSTLLSIVAGLLYPTSGSVACGVYKVDRASESLWNIIRSQHLGYVFQAPLLISELSVLENVMTRGLVQGLHISQCEQEAYDLLRALDIEKLAHARPCVLSGGEQQRVSLARALLGKPAFILMDEPTAHLDSVARQRFLELLKNVQNNYAVGLIIATHDPVISDTMDEAWSIDHGKLQRMR